MLYNPKWEKLKPMTLPHFIAWLERFPGETDYKYCNMRICLARQYCDSVGEKYIPAVNYSLRFRNQMEHIAAEHPHTFEGALARARHRNRSLFNRIRNLF
jgi:hypothetical protein